MWDQWADIRFAFLMWAGVAGQAMYSAYQPDMGNLLPILTGASLPATVVIAILHVTALGKKTDAAASAVSVNSTPSQSRNLNLMYAVAFCGLLVVGFIAFTGKGKTPQAIAELAKARNGQLILDATKQYMPQDYAKIDTLLTTRTTSGKTDEQVKNELIELMSVCTEKGIKNSSVPTLKRFFAVRIDMLSEIAAKDTEKAYEVLMFTAWRKLSYEDVSPELNRRVAEVMRDIIKDGSQGKFVPQDNARAFPALEKAIANFSQKEVELFSSENPKDKAAYVRTWIKACKQIALLPDEDAVQVYRGLFTDTAP